MSSASDSTPEHAQVRLELREQLLEQIILQDYPKPQRGLFALGVHYIYK